MRKKLLVMVVSCLMATSIVACGESNVSTVAQTESKTTMQTDDTTEQTNAETALTLQGLEEYLLDKGVLSGEKKPVAAEMIGAVSGFKYADSNAEFYEYDVDSEKYKQLKAGESVEIEGMTGFTITATSINGKFVLISSGNENVSQELIDAFDLFGK